MQLTYIGSNSWFLEIGDRRILLDPWLVGDLVFGNAPWLFKGTHRTPPISPENIDLILLSQGLEDHAHRPTLEKLAKTVPIVGSPNAAKVSREIGFETVIALPHGKAHTAGNLEIHAFPGAPVGPQRENAYLLKDLATGKTLYYEPHGFPPQEIQKCAPIDAVISPLLSLKIPLIGPVINGSASAPQLATWLQPKYFFGTAAGGDIEFSGILNSLLKVEGSAEALQAQLQAKNIATEVIDPTPGQPIAIA